MVWVAGADGCRGGWFRASRHTGTGELRFHLLGAAHALLETLPAPALLGVDMPIGLPAAGPRECDRLARIHLGWPRRSSVFPVPIRPALGAKSRETASRITALRDGRRVCAQAFALTAKIRELDALLQGSPDARRRIREVHPELSFWAWSGGRPMDAGKRSTAGRHARRRLAERWLGAGILARARGAHPRRDLADDDVLDAIAVLWTATRIARGEARGLPDPPPRDPTGLPMEIVY